MLAAVQRIDVAPDPELVRLACSFLVAATLLRLAVSSDGSIALALEGCGAFFGSIAVTAPLAYVATRSPHPAVDMPIARVEAVLGFDPAGWRAALFRIPILRTAAFGAYASFLPQYLVALVMLPRTRHPRRGLELMRMSVLTICFSYVVAFFLPTIGTIPAVEPWARAWHALHDGRTLFRAGHQILPIVSLPSYHAAMAVMLGYSMRGLGRFSCLVVCLDIAMLLATPVMGDRHLVDLVAGAALAVVSILITRRCMSREAAPALERSPNTHIKLKERCAAR